MFDNGTLVIKHVKKNDQGRYSCVGISESGPVQTFVSELVLACKYCTIQRVKCTK